MAAPPPRQTSHSQSQSQSHSAAAAPPAHGAANSRAPTKVIIDTDPGIDDINAILLALASPPEDLEVLLISATHGNVDVKNCTRNIVAMFHIIEREREWRRSQGLAPGFEGLDHYKPIVAVGPAEPLGEQQRMADYFHGMDGLGGIHETHPHLFSKDPWEDLFELPPPESQISAAARETTNTARPSPKLFTPSHRPSHLEILSILASNPPDTVSIIAIGPLTNIALAAAHDPVTLCRAKELIIMGGALSEPGNITPLAEFNVYADAFAAARVFALTSPLPASTMPPKPPIPEAVSAHSSRLRDLPASYPSPSALGLRRLNIVLFPLDITERHEVFRKDYLARIKPLLEKKSPMAEWHEAFMAHSFRMMEDLHLGHAEDTTSVVLHDALCVWWALDASRNGFSTSSEALQPQTASEHEFQNSKGWSLSTPIDIRIESSGQWTRGSCVIDRRDRKKQVESDADAQALGPRKGDDGAWLSDKRGNRVTVCMSTPGRDEFRDILWGTIFGVGKS